MFYFLLTSRVDSVLSSSSWTAGGRAAVWGAGRCCAPLQFILPAWASSQTDWQIIYQAGGWFLWQEEVSVNTAGGAEGRQCSDVDDGSQTPVWRGSERCLTPAPGTPHGGEEPAPADPPSEWGITPLTTAPHTQSQSRSVFLVLISEQLVLKTQDSSVFKGDKLQTALQNRIFLFNHWNYIQFLHCMYLIMYIYFTQRHLSTLVFWSGNMVLCNKVVMY